jgi:hypothetical protein
MDRSWRRIELGVAACYVVGILLITLFVRSDNILLAVGLGAVLAIGEVLSLRYLRSLKDG